MFVFKKLSVTKQVIITFVILITIVVFFGILTMFSLGKIEARNEMLEDYALPKLDIIASVNHSVGTVEVNVYRHVLSSDLQKIKAYDNAIRNVINQNTQKLNNYEKYITKEQGKYLYRKVLKARDEYLTHTENLLALSRKGLDNEATEYANSNQRASYDEYLNAMTNLSDFVEKDVLHNIDTTNIIISSTRKWSHTLLWFGLIIGISLGYVVTQITSKLKKQNRTLETEILEREKIEKALKASEERYREIFETNLAGQYISSIKGDIIDCNLAFANIFGYPNIDEVKNVSAFDFYLSFRERKLLLELLQEKNKLQNYRVRMKNREGKVLYVLNNIVGDYDKNGNLIQIRGFVIDETERLDAEEKIRTSEERYRNLVESARDIIFQMSIDGRITSLNSAFGKITGWENQKWMGKSFSDLIHPDDRNLVRKMFQQTIQGEHSPLCTVRIFSRENKIIFGEFTTTLQKQNDKPVAVLGIIRDVTERVQLEEHIRQIQKHENLGSLAGGIAHDFNNILGIILGHISLLQKYKKEPEKLTSSIESIDKVVQRGTGLVRQILTFARKTDVMFESVNVNAAIEEIVRLIKETFPKIISYDLHLDEQLSLITADHNQLHQALLNLCVNARDAMSKGGVLAFSTKVIDKSVLEKRFPDVTENQYVCITISDTGVGMDQSVQKRIFEPFFTTKEHGKGTGLGLSVVYGIVASHHGFIDVESKLGYGTTFFIYLPVPQKDIKIIKDIQKAPEGYLSGKETILVVEDEEMLRELIINILTSNGYRVLSASDGLEALEIFERHIEDISLVLLDMGLPKISGKELFIKLKELDPGVVVILASGYVDPVNKSDILKLGAKDFIQKPYNPIEILKKIRETINSK